MHFYSDTMKPNVNNEAWKKAFEIYKETGKYGPPDELNYDIGDTRALFKAGRCGLLIEWGDPGPLQYDPDVARSPASCSPSAPSARRRFSIRLPASSCR